jgi:hypothetical protein
MLRLACDAFKNFLDSAGHRYWSGPEIAGVLWSWNESPLIAAHRGLMRTLRYERWMALQAVRVAAMIVLVFALGCHHR